MDASSVTDDEVKAFKAALSMTEEGIRRRMLTATKYSSEPRLALRILELKKKELQGPEAEFNAAMAQLDAEHSAAVRIHIVNKREADALRMQHQKERFQSIKEELENDAALSTTEARSPVRRNKKTKTHKRKARDEKPQDEDEDGSENHDGSHVSAACAVLSAEDKKKRAAKRFVSSHTRDEAEATIRDAYPSADCVLLTVHRTPLAYPFDTYLLHPVSAEELKTIDEQLSKTCRCKFNALFWNALIAKHKKAHKHFSSSDPLGKTISSDESVSWTTPALRTVVWPQ